MFSGNGAKNRIAVAGEKEAPGSRRELLQGDELAFQQGVEFFASEVDLDFHLAIGTACGNPLMRSIANVIEAALVASFSMSSPVDDASDHEVTSNSHAAIVDAIEARDEAAAAAAMLKVIDIGVRRIDSSRRKRGSRK